MTPHTCFIHVMQKKVKNVAPIQQTHSALMRQVDKPEPPFDVLLCFCPALVQSTNS